MSSQCTVDFSKPDHVIATLRRFDRLTITEKLSVTWLVVARLRNWIPAEAHRLQGPISNPLVVRPKPALTMQQSAQPTATPVINPPAPDRPATPPSTPSVMRSTPPSAPEN